MPAQGQVRVASPSSSACTTRSLRDQYRHPEEHRHTIAEVKRWFAATDVDYLRSFPSPVFDDDGRDLFSPAIDHWALEVWIAQIGWMWTLGLEGGLFFAIGRRR